MPSRLRHFTVLISISVIGLLQAQNIRLITPETIEFGRLPEGRTVEGDLRFTNAGSAPLQIERVQASCGCTTTKIERMKVEPGDTASLHYAVRTQGFRGTVRKTITVSFTDSKEKELVFVIQGTLYSDLEVTPSFIDFQRVALDLDSTVMRKVTVKNQTEKPIQVTSIRATSKLLAVSPGKAFIPAGQSLAIQVTLKPLRVETQDADIWIETDSSSRPKIAIPVFIQVGARK